MSLEYAWAVSILGAIALLWFLVGLAPYALFWIWLIAVSVLLLRRR